MHGSASCGRCARTAPEARDGYCAGPLDFNTKEFCAMTIKAGERMPEGKFKTMGEKGPKDLTTAELFGGKRVVLFSVPGAFTPTCDAKHLPGYLGLADQLRAKGVDTIACMAVNDVFVMNAWGKQSGVGDKVLMLADGNGEYARALGLELDAKGFGMGMRGQRFAIVVDKGVATRVEVEAPGQFKVSAAEHLLAQL
jgi:peroxiredoxin